MRLKCTHCASGGQRGRCGLNVRRSRRGRGRRRSRRGRGRRWSSRGRGRRRSRRGRGRRWRFNEPFASHAILLSAVLYGSKLRLGNVGLIREVPVATTVPLAEVIDDRVRALLRPKVSSRRGDARGGDTYVVIPFACKPLAISHLRPYCTQSSALRT